VPRQTWAFILVGLLAVGLRLHHLGTESVWLDEATSIETAHDPLWKIPQDAAEDVHPPLYYLMLHGWVQAWGDSERAVRSLSVVYSLGTLVALVVFARRWLDDRTAVVVGLLSAVSPLEIAFAQEARMYALLTLLAVISTDAFLRLLSSGSKRAGVLYVVATAAMLYTHAYAAFVIAGQVVWFAGVLIATPDRRVWLWRAFLGLGLTAVAFLPWLSSLLAQVRGVEQAFWIPPNATIAGALAAQSGSVILAWVLVPFVLAALVRPPRGRRVAALLAAIVLAVIGGPWLLSRLSSPIFLPKYTIACSPAFLLLAARGLAGVSQRTVRTALVVAVVGLTGLPLRTYFGAPHKDDWRRVATGVEAQARAGDLVIYSQPFGAAPFRYYARRRDLVEIPFLDEHRGLTTYALNVLADSAIRRAARVWLVTADPDEATEALRRRLAEAVEVVSIPGGGVEARLFVPVHTSGRTPGEAAGPNEKRAKN
jgi:hypothetical protein